MADLNLRLFRCLALLVLACPLSEGAKARNLCERGFTAVKNFQDLRERANWSASVLRDIMERASEKVTSFDVPVFGLAGVKMGIPQADRKGWSKVKVSLESRYLNHEIVVKVENSKGADSDSIDQLLSKLKVALAELPVMTSPATSEIVLYARQVRTSGVAYENGFTLFNHSSNHLTYTAVHEHGHNVAQFLWHDSSFRPAKIWVDIMNKDFQHSGKKGITDYAMTNIAEDFAESFEQYCAWRGGTRNMNLRLNFPHRFAFFDELLSAKRGGLNGDFWQNIAKYHRKKEEVIRGSVITIGVSVIGGVLTYYLLEKD